MWTARSLTGQVLLRQRRDDVLKAERAYGCAWSPPAHRPFLASSPSRVCKCRERKERVCHALPVVLRQNKSSRGRRCDNGEHLDRGREREKAGSRIDRGLAQAVPLQSRQKRGGFPSLGTPHVHASGDTWTIILVDSPHEPAVCFPARDGKVGSERARRSKVGTIWQPPGKGLGTLPWHFPHEMASIVRRPQTRVLRG